MIYRTLTTASLTVVAAFAFVACGGDEAPAPPAATAAAPAAAADTAAPTPPPASNAAAANADAGFPPDQLDALVAPIALYPDALLMQVLMASTYPTEIVMADRWRRDHADLEGAALDDALAQQEWDPSVSSLTFFPDVLGRMSQNLDWTTDLGDAFLAQQDDVLDACQRMRRLAADAGTLQTTKEQTVVVEKEVVKIEPANPEVVYVPQYNSTTAYGSTYQPAPQYYPAVQTGYSGATLATASILSFGVGMLTSYAIWGGCDWDDHDVYYHGHGGGGGPKYVNKTQVNINGDVNIGGNRGRPSWNHNPQHRRGVAYAQPRTRDRYARQDPRRTRFDEKRTRGYDRTAALGNRDRPAARPANRPAATGGGRPTMPARPTAKPAAKKPTQMAKPASRPAAKPAAKPAARPSTAGKSAFGGTRNANVQRQASQRGAVSRGRSSGGGRQGRDGGGKRRGGRKGR